MTRSDALRCIAVLTVFDRRVWTDAQVIAWTDAVQLCDDVDRGMEASQTLVQGCDPRLWSLYAWREAYQSAARRVEVLALPPVEEEPIALKEHLSRLSLGANCGDRDAAKELADWRKRGRKYFPDEAAL